jgi:rubrerythrin
LSDLLNLDLIDTDGAIRDSAEAMGIDRSTFIKRGAIAGGGLIAGGAFFSSLSLAEAAISKKKSKKNDVKILNFALTLEFLEAAFYKQAVANAAYGSDATLKKFAEIVAKHEAAHVKFLKGALGSAAIKSPTFDFGKAVTDTATFAATAQVLEDTGVTAYLGQVTNVFQAGVLGAAGTIATVEARHASWIRFINGATPAPAAYDTRKSEAAILKAVGGTGFIK